MQAAPASDPDATGPIFSRVLLFRHVAICASAAVAYLLRSEIPIGYHVLAIVTISAGLNFLFYLLHPLRGADRISRLGATVIGVTSWAALILLTGGTGSPFIAGLWLEVILASMVFSARGVAVVTAAAFTALLGQQLLRGIEGVELVLAFELAFVAAIGVALTVLRLRAQHREAALAAEQAALGMRLEDLQLDLESERALGRVGENVGRLAHRLKNVVHSLRGFAGLLEGGVDERSRAALDGLKQAIDDLDELARNTLDDGNDLRRRRRHAPGGALRATEQAVGHARESAPGVVWTIEAPEEGLPALSVPEEDLFEVVQILVRNAIEAMGSQGHGRVLLTAAAPGGLEIAVEDDGPGLSEADLERAFQPGYTTKPEGSGYGLFLARRILAKYGGELVARTKPDGGAVFAVQLPPGDAKAGEAEVPAADASPEK